MAKKGKDDKGLQELQTVSSVSLPTVFVLYVELYLLCMHKQISVLQDATYIAEQSSGKCCILALRPIDTQNVEEAVLRVQGFITDAKLPPVRQSK